MGAIDVVYVALVGLTILSFCLNRRYNLKHWKLIVCYLALIAATALTAFGTTMILKVENNLFIFHIFTPLDYSIIAFLYATVFESQKIKRAVIISIPLFTSVCITLALTIQPVTANNSVAVVIESALVIFWSVLFIHETIMDQKVDVLARYPMFWISVGFLFYFVGDHLIEGLLNVMMEQSMEVARAVYRLMYVLRYCLMALLLVGCFCERLFRGRVREVV